MSDFTKWVDLVNKLRTENAALTAERDRLKEKVALLRTRLERTNIILAQRDLDIDEWQELSEGHDLLEATK